MGLNSTSIKIESNMTLSKMLGEGNTIEIPIIQRDYAQGRKNAKEIRNDFLKDIFVHLNDDRAMKLSFVYGTSNGSMFVPYDGQQRLTLVYLLTLFLSAYCEDWDSVKKLSRFNYYTRDHATAFCQFLTGFDTEFEDGKKNVFQRISIQDKRNIAESIKNDSSFFGSWSYEPTVSSMIVVLQSIQEEFMNITEKLNHDERISKAKTFSDRIDNGKIFFDWCSIQASDNIYIKMNGRGKPLSAFDNFKNTLYAELDKLRKYAVANGEIAKVDFLSDFEVKMDGVWTDLFWKNRNVFAGTDNYDIAPYMMNFLYYIFEFRYAVSCSSFFFGGRESFRWIDEKNVVTFLVKFKDLCDVNNAGKKRRITLDDYIWASKILDIISTRLLSQGTDTSLPFDNYPDEIQLIKELSSHKGSVASSRTVIVSSLYYEYLVRASGFDAHGSLVSSDYPCRDQWVGLIGRLIRTASVFKARYDSLLRDKHILSGYVNVFVPTAFANTASGDFLVSSKEFDCKKLKEIKPYFDVSHVYSQLAEEIEKYKLRSSDPAAWTAPLEQAERELPFFGNMIYFLIKLSEDSNGAADINQFMKYLNLMKQVVNEKGINNQNYFTAIMLSNADYRISSGEGYSNSWSLCSNTSNETFFWRYFFDVLEGGIAEKGKTKISVLKYALDQIEIHGDTKSAYDSIAKNQNDPSWKSVVIRYPEVLDMGSRHRIIYQDGSNWYLIKSDGVVKQVHSNSLLDSINIELFGLYKSSINANKITYDSNKIIIDKDSFIRKDNDYIIHDSNGEKKVNFDDVLNYLDNL